MPLTPDDVRDIVRVLDSSGVDEMRLDLGEMTLSVRREGSAGWSAEQQLTRDPVLAGDAAPSADEPTRTQDTDTPDGLVAVRPPLLGTFYRAPQPGADPFVDVGDTVREDTVVGIVETMKMMTPVPAGVAGTVVEFRTGNGEFVETDGVLLLVEPAQ